MKSTVPDSAHSQLYPLTDFLSGNRSGGRLRRDWSRPAQKHASLSAPSQYPAEMRQTQHETDNVGTIGLSVGFLRQIDGDTSGHWCHWFEQRSHTEWEINGVQAMNSGNRRALYCPLTRWQV